jgi:hypothetical protein
MAWLPGAASGAAVNLAVFRIVVCLTVLASADVHAAPGWARLPPQLPVPGSLQVLTVLPFGPALARPAWAILLVASLLGVLGLWTRWALAVATLAAAYLLGLPQLAGQPTHVHHLVWFLALLAASPSGDALSLDALRSGERLRDGLRLHGRRYGVPLLYAWLLLAAVFFFPGLWKVVTSGSAWIAADNLRNLLHWKWLQNGLSPPRIDRWPGLLTLLAAMAVAFELSAPALLWHHHTRLVLLVGALLFHAFTAAFLGIHFGVLWACYVVLIDWGRLARRRPPGEPIGADPRAPLRSTLVVGTLLLVGVVQAGARHDMRGWPFACYPTFQWLSPDTTPGVDVELVDARGQSRIVSAPLLFPPSERPAAWNAVLRVTAAPLPERRDRARRHLLPLLQQRSSLRTLLPGARTVRLWRVVRPVRPEAASDAGVRSGLLLEIAGGTP